MGSLIVKNASNIKGSICVSGSKNAAIPIICCSIINKGIVKLHNIPRITDIYNILSILKHVGCVVKWNKYLLIDSTKMEYKPLLLDECKSIRGSYYLIPVFLYLFNKCEILLPGGCSIGKRPIDEHIRGFKALGYKVIENNNVLIIEGKCNIDDFYYKLEKKSVGATINLIIACLKCKNAEINNVVIEPEGHDLINFLNQMGFNVRYDKDKCFVKQNIINNVNLSYKVIPDRIEAITYIILGLLCGTVNVRNVNLEHIKYPLKLLLDNGFKINIKNNNITACKSMGKCFDIKTDTYPNFPTDMQPIFGVLLACSRGCCCVEETIFENRMQIYYDLNKIGGFINVVDNKAYIIGTNINESVNTTCMDLRHGAAVLILSIKNGGVINNVEIIQRGYENLFEKLKGLGCKIILKKGIVNNDNIC